MTYHISFDRERGELTYGIRETASGLLAATWCTLNEAAEWIARPRCTYMAEHPDMAGPDGLGGGYLTEYCDHPISHRLLILDAELHALSDDEDGRVLYLLCDGHAAMLRDDIYAGDWPDATILSDDQSEAMPMA